MTRTMNTPLASALLSLAAASLLPMGCGESRFMGNAQPTPKPTTEPPPPAPPAAAPADVLTSGPRALSNVAKPKPSGTPSLTQVGVGTGTAPSISLPANVQPAMQAPTSAAPKFVDISAANAGIVRVSCPEGVLGRVIDDTCVEVANLYVWSNGSKVFLDTQIDDKACPSAGAAGCTGFKLHEGGFSFRGVLGQVFPEASRAKLTRVRVATSLLVVCRGATSDEYVFNPGTSDDARLKQCGTGSRSFYVASAARAGFLGIHRAALGAATGATLLAVAPASGALTSSPYLTGTLVSLGAAGYVVDP